MSGRRSVSFPIPTQGSLRLIFLPFQPGARSGCDDLKSLGADVLSIPTEHAFYLSRRLDLDEQKQEKADQRSIRFDRYKGRTVLEITGNYCVAYSVEKMSPEQCAKATFDAIIFPILKIEIPRFQSNPDVQGLCIRNLSPYPR
jgi:hypothetical protein